MIEICALASGSNGNCYYVGDENVAVLVDCGISRRLLLERMGERGLKIERVKAIFITHEHKDHIQGVKAVADKHQIPAYMTHETLMGVRSEHRPHIYTLIENEEFIEVGGFKVYPVQKQHDARNPRSFRVERDGFNVGVFTDIGAPCNNVVSHVLACDFLFLESNYEDALLQAGRYPEFLKSRVASDFGHLSNHQSRELVDKCDVNKLKVLYLAHISEDNNSSELVMKKFEDLQDRIDVRLTNRYTASEVHRIDLSPLLPNI